MTRVQEIFNRLDAMDLSEKARDVIATSDQFTVVDLFGDCKTSEEVEDIVREYFEEV